MHSQSDYAQSESQAPANRLLLHGKWRRSIGGQLIDLVAVPGCYPPVGACDLAYAFQIPWDVHSTAERYFLCTEGVLTKAVFTVNGHTVGAAGPWTPYEFELPPGILSQTNTINAAMTDIQEAFGPTPGRQIDAGLFRDLFIERRPSAFIESVLFRPSLNDDYDSADCELLVAIDGPTMERVEAALTEQVTGRQIASAAADPGEPLTFTVERPRLWSPDDPYLYDLTVRLGMDDLHESVGFRRIEVRGQDFYLNGKRLFLKGVCRHEFTSASSYCPPDAEVRRELALIKHTGFNFVRLVHSPQSRNVPRIAAELGLLVTEEPGTCWQDLGIDEVAAPALEVLRRAVLRDRNCPSVFAWHIYNECNPNNRYAIRAAGICRELDPDRLISFADCSRLHDEVHEMVRAADLSFYGINWYSGFPHEYLECMSRYADRPLVITEWGGWLAEGNPRVMKSLCDTFARCSRTDSTSRLAGCSFWAWADYREYSRDDPACTDGWTDEGLLDKHGQPKPDIQMLSAMCMDIDNPPPPVPPKVEVLIDAPLRAERWTSIPLDAVEGDQSALEKAIDQSRTFAYLRPEFGELLIDGILFACRGNDGIAPLLIGPGRETVIIPIDRQVRSIAVLGNVALTGGYPSSGLVTTDPRHREGMKEFGAPASRYFFDFDDGCDEQILLHGIHVLRANNICRWWMTAPRAPGTRPAVQAVLHPTFEVLRFDLWEHDFGRPRYLRSLHWILDDTTSIQGLAAISVLP